MITWIAFGQPFGAVIPGAILIALLIVAVIERSRAAHCRLDRSDIAASRLILILRLSLISSSRPSSMLQAFVITLREGLEAFLIVAISLVVPAQVRAARSSTAAVHWGIAVAVAVSALGGYLLFNARNQEWLDGPLALVAAASVTWMIVHMWRAGRRMKGDIEGRLADVERRAGRRRRSPASSSSRC